MNDICCIGHITLDKIVTPKQTGCRRNAVSRNTGRGASE